MHYRKFTTLLDPRKCSYSNIDSATNELPLSAINYRANSTRMGALQLGTSASLNEQIFETILLLPEIVKHSRISLMATNERPLSCSTCVFGPLSTSNSLNNLSGGRRSSLLNTIDEEAAWYRAPLLLLEHSDSAASQHEDSVDSGNGGGSGSGGGDRKPSLARSISAPELYSDALISDSVSLELASDDASWANTTTTATAPPVPTLKALRFRGNKSMSVDATAVMTVAVEDPRTLLIGHLKSASFLAQILEPIRDVHATDPLVDSLVECSGPGPLTRHDRIVEEDSVLAINPPSPPELSELTSSSHVDHCYASLDDLDNSPLVVHVCPSLAEVVDNKNSATDHQPQQASPCRLRSNNHPLPNVVLLSNNTSSPTTAPSVTTTTTTTARRPRHSFAGQMSYSKLWGFGSGAGGKKMPAHTSTNSLFSTAVISGSSSAPNLRDMIQNANTTGKERAMAMDITLLHLLS